MPYTFHTIRFRVPYDPVTDDTEINGATGMPYTDMMVVTEKVATGDPYTPPTVGSMVVFRTGIISDYDDDTMDTHETYYQYPSVWQPDRGYGALPTNEFNFTNTTPRDIALSQVEKIWFVR